jgi:hypothetical protein
MQGGDISNEVPTRIAITEAMLLDDIEAERTPRFLRRRPDKMRQVVKALPIDRSMLARTWQYSNRNGVSWELLMVGRPPGWGDLLLDRLNDEGMHAIARTIPYDTYHDIGRDLAWRSYLIGVVDAAERRLIYGGRYLDPGRIA